MGQRSCNDANNVQLLQCWCLQEKFAKFCDAPLSAEQFARSSVLLIVVRRLGQLLGKLQHGARELVVPHHSNKYFS